MSTLDNQRRYRERHREALRVRAREYYHLNKDKEHIRRRIWRDTNRDKLREIQRISDARPERRAKKAEQERSEKRKATRLAYKKNNPRTDWCREYERRYRIRRKELHDDKQINDPQYRLRRTLRASLKNAIKNSWRAGSAIDALGCSILDLRAYLEAQFLDGMNWNNFGRLDNSGATWQIDHIQPLSSFDLTDKTQLWLACHFTNLRPLWALDNRRKGNKVLGGKEVSNGL